MRFCVELHDEMDKPKATAALRIAYIEAMCAEASCDLLCWAMDNGLAQGDAHAERWHACAMCSSGCIFTCRLKTNCALRRAEQAGQLLGAFEMLAWTVAQAAIGRLLEAYAGDELPRGTSDTMVGMAHGTRRCTLPPVARNEHVPMAHARSEGSAPQSSSACSQLSASASSRWRERACERGRKVARTARGLLIRCTKRNADHSHSPVLSKS